MAYLFNGYWEDIGTIESFFNANLALTHNVSGPQAGGAPGIRSPASPHACASPPKDDRACEPVQW